MAIFHCYVSSPEGIYIQPILDDTTLRPSGVLKNVLLAGQIPELNRGFRGQTIYKWWIVHCHVSKNHKLRRLTALEYRTPNRYHLGTKFPSGGLFDVFDDRVKA